MGQEEKLLQKGNLDNKSTRKDMDKKNDTEMNHRLMVTWHPIGGGPTDGMSHIVTHTVSHNLHKLKSKWWFLQSILIFWNPGFMGFMNWKPKLCQINK